MKIRSDIYIYSKIEWIFENKKPNKAIWQKIMIFGRKVKEKLINKKCQKKNQK